MAGTKYGSLSAYPLKMIPDGTSGYILAVQEAGAASAAAGVFKFGYQGDVDTGDVPEDIIDAGGLQPWPTAEATTQLSAAACRIQR